MEPVSLSSVSLSDEDNERINQSIQAADAINKTKDRTYFKDLDRLFVANKTALRIKNSFQDYKTVLISMAEFIQLLNSNILLGSLEPQIDKDKVLVGWYCNIGDVKVYVASSITAPSKKIDPGFILLGYEP